MQHLNLYSQIEREVEPPFSARVQLRLLGAAAGVMIAVYLVLLLGTGSTKSELEKVRAQQQSVSAQLAKLQSEKARLQNNPALDAEIAGLERDLAFRQRLLSKVRPGSGVSSNGFAEQLSGLARQHIDGMWFTEIQLHQGGSQMTLMGETREPEYVPRYLQKLASEPVFQGLNFRVFRMYVPEDHKNLHSFELRARDVGELQGKEIGLR